MGDVARRRIGAATKEAPRDVSLIPTLRADTSALPASSAQAMLRLGGRRGEYGLGDLARELKLTYRETRRVIDTLRGLARHSGMPLPRNPRMLKGREVTGPGAIHAGSIWDAGEIDAWMDGRCPPGGASASVCRVAPPIRAEMARRAQVLAA